MGDKAIILINGKKYKSLRSACKDTNLNIYNFDVSTISKRIKSGDTIEDAFRNAPSHKKSISLVINGKTYSSLAAAIRDKELNIHNLTYNTVLTRLKRGYKLDNVFDLDRMVKAIKTEYKGKVYKSLNILIADKTVNIHNISYDAICNRLKNGTSLEDALRLPRIRNRDYGNTEVTINGKTYKSIVEAVKDKELNIHNHSIGLIYNRKQSRISLEDAFNNK